MGNICCSCFDPEDPEGAFDFRDDSQYATVINSDDEAYPVNNAQANTNTSDDISAAQLGVNSNHSTSNLQMAQLSNPSSTIVLEQSKEKNIEKSDICYHYSSLDDDDVCPTCLEEYSFDNPRILTKCNHHFHLGCIYEWKERSPNCPTCGKVMIFDEA